MQGQEPINWDKIIDVLANQTSMQDLTEKEKVIIDKILATGSDKDMLFALENLDEKKAWQKIQNQLRKPSKTPVINIHKRQAYKSWAVAAAVLLVISTGAYFFLTRDKESQLVETKQLETDKINEIVPGSDKAILTLADGSKIVLDSAAKGAISKQGHVTIINLEGQLAYNLDGVDMKEVMYNTITTPRGGQYQLVLADGTRVWLNSASSLRFPTAFVGNDRIVEIIGEGYFEVAHDAKKPFYVSKNDVQVQVLGTQFNVNAYEDETDIKITLIEGSVKVAVKDQSVIIKPGEQAMITDKIKTATNVDIEQVTAWKNGYFNFNNADIETVMRQAVRWYDVDVKYESRTGETFSGSMPRAENISQLLQILEATGKVDFRINERQIVVKPKQ